jgi:hypothetical protein
MLFSVMLEEFARVPPFGIIMGMLLGSIGLGFLASS